MRTSHEAPLSRRGMLKGAAATGMAVAGLGAAGPAHAAAAPLRATARMGGTAVTLSVVDGALRWSATRGGRTVIDTSALGLVLSDGTVLGSDVTVIRSRRRTVHSKWSPVYGRNATVTDHYQEQR